MRDRRRFDESARTMVRSKVSICKREVTNGVRICAQVGGGSRSRRNIWKCAIKTTGIRLQFSRELGLGAVVDEPWGEAPACSIFPESVRN